ncbi:unnamed protein product [Linum tenue]|uniref:Uncharacterized protein n=1 Tax=Linum tenue TaxID=586396 RepID=A0AAV0RHP0_9ROSI|nr:unnamed protein product [Linum tenue]
MAEAVDVNAKWDACIDLTVRRFVYSSMAGAFGGLLFFSQFSFFFSSLPHLSVYQ